MRVVEFSVAKKAIGVADAIEDLYGLRAGRLQSASEIQRCALACRGASWNGDNATCLDTLIPLAQADDPFEAALLWNVAGPLFDPLVFYWMEVILAAVPFRQEAYWVEVPAPHRLWLAENGIWTLDPRPLFDRAAPMANALPIQSRFRERVRRAFDLRQLLMSPTSKNAANLWDPVAAAQLEPELLGSGCGPVLDVLVRSFLADQAAALEIALACCQQSPSRVVRCARAAVLEARSAWPKSQSGAWLANARAALRRSSGGRPGPE